MTAHMWWWTWVVETWLQVTLGSKSWLRGLKLFFCLNSGHQRLQSKPTFGMWVYNNMKSSLYFCLLNIFGQWLTLHWQTWLSQGSKLDIFVFQLFSVGLQRQLAGSLLVSAPASDTRIIGNFYIPSFNLCLTYMSIYMKWSTTILKSPAYYCFGLSSAMWQCFLSLWSGASLHCAFFATCCREVISLDVFQCSEVTDWCRLIQRRLLEY